MIIFNKNNVQRASNFNFLSALEPNSHKTALTRENKKFLKSLGLKLKAK